MVGLWSIMVVASPAPSTYLPCHDGLRLEYRVERNGVDTMIRVFDQIRGEKAPLCIVDRTTQPGEGPARTDAYAREHLPDRILSAGWLPHLVALRIPLLRAPLVQDAEWRFGAVQYRVKEAHATMLVPAGRFEDVLVVEERALDGSGYRAVSAYAPGIGLIRRAEGRDVRVLMSVERPIKRQSNQTFKGRDGPSPGVVPPSCKP